MPKRAPHGRSSRPRSALGCVSTPMFSLRERLRVKRWEAGGAKSTPGQGATPSTQLELKPEVPSAAA